ncbi:hypothetical protein [Paenibacillus roseipurpureus]|uniref:Uncharacterized protein n=1 Tax=Paenibacillus roseopurpureus TaxID=2918901 RepID=A0AA96LPR9_9BACL|nr:hypothetical protein [Paenibacillus sp. MBLB1832]WNR44366.1 hypothetical protein MJB10_25440 [Paenibacillus sp. MBLB1832]
MEDWIFVNILMKRWFWVLTIAGVTGVCLSLSHWVAKRLERHQN